MEYSGNFLHFFSVDNGETKSNLPKKPVAGCCVLLAEEGLLVIKTDSQKQKIPSGKPEGTISCAGKLAFAFRLICFPMNRKTELAP
jgi:hypothetical protein